jgi:putative flavoprotein involved in K+ transport
MGRRPEDFAAPSVASSHHDVVVVGAGQAGLTMGFLLRRSGRPFLIVDRAAWIAAAWRERWDSLTLFTPRRFSGLPGLAFPGDPDGYPSRDEVIDYLEHYAQTFELPVELNSAVRRLAPAGQGFLLETENGTITAEQAVVATGPFQTPYVPELGTRLGPDVFQAHSTGYRSPGALPEGTALVVGGGNTGYQIAKELSATHEVHLSVGSRQKPLPQRPLGRDLFWWLTKSRLLGTTVESPLGKRLSQRDALIGSSPRELRRRYGVRLRKRALDASGRIVRFADGSELEVDAVIWATGYRPEHSWIDAPIFDPSGRVRHRRGVTDVPGLYFLGLTWQHTRGSALLGWVENDAAFIAERIEQALSRPGGAAEAARGAGAHAALIRERR